MNIDDLFIQDLPTPDNLPFPNIVSNKIINLNILELAYLEFPSISNPKIFGDLNFKGTLAHNLYPDSAIGNDIFNLLLSDSFCEILKNKFNTPKLTATTIGGGYHITNPGGRLSVHIDWQRFCGLYRWLNLHIYLNKNWVPDNGGELLILQNNDMFNPGYSKKIEPSFGTTAIFLSSTNAWHGHPKPWNSKLPRMALSVYYFAKTPPDGYDESRDVFEHVDQNRIDYIMNI